MILQWQIWKTFEFKTPQELLHVLRGLRFFGMEHIDLKRARPWSVRGSGQILTTDAIDGVGLYAVTWTQKCKQYDIIKKVFYNLNLHCSSKSWKTAKKMFTHSTGKLGRSLKNFGNWGSILFLIRSLYHLIISCYKKK